jgi:hypothetical protein
MKEDLNHELEEGDKLLDDFRAFIRENDGQETFRAFFGTDAELVYDSRNEASDVFGFPHRVFIPLEEAYRQSALVLFGAWCATRKNAKEKAAAATSAK